MGGSAIRAPVVPVTVVSDAVNLLVPVILRPFNLLFKWPHDRPRMPPEVSSATMTVELWLLQDRAAVAVVGVATIPPPTERRERAFVFHVALPPGGWAQLYLALNFASNCVLAASDAR